MYSYLYCRNLQTDAHLGQLGSYQLAQKYLDIKISSRRYE
jgi:hypothetical protein